MSIPQPHIAIAPMMDCTDRHDRYFLRLISPNVLLYTEMITAQAIHHGDPDYLLQYSPQEHPVALQLGGCDLTLLAEAAKIGEDFGYDEINLNIGCPSPRVKSGSFGACLMRKPNLVAECVAAMRKVVQVPVTVKCRIGVDDQEEYASLHHFISTVSAAGCKTFIVHARKAWLNGLSPKENREIPPLRYDIVYQVKRDFPTLNIIINGGIKTVASIQSHLESVDGVMIGREAYANPYLLAQIERDIFNNQQVLSRQAVIRAMLPYIRDQLAAGSRLSSITRHLFGLFVGQPGARYWRRYLSENTFKSGADEALLLAAMGENHHATT